MAQLPPAASYRSPRALVRSLVRRGASAERAAFDALFESWFARIHAVALERLADRDRARQVTQRVFETLLAHWPEGSLEAPGPARVLATLLLELERELGGTPEPTPSD